jgi:hypothetical protein
MVYVRQTIVSDASTALSSTALSRAVCIAARYSDVRRQFGGNNGSLESQVFCTGPIKLFYEINLTLFDLLLIETFRQTLCEC